MPSTAYLLPPTTYDLPPTEATAPAGPTGHATLQAAGSVA
jgi:hypothetical protein